MCWGWCGQCGWLGEWHNAMVVSTPAASDEVVLAMVPTRLGTTTSP